MGSSASKAAPQVVKQATKRVKRAPVSDTTLIEGLQGSKTNRPPVFGAF